MRLTIDNLDGHGAVEYSGAVAAEGPLTIERVLNAPSRCAGMLDVGDLAVPVRRARLVVAADDGTVLFTGYLATEPEAVYAGVGFAGPVYRFGFAAVSDEWLLDKQAPALTGVGYAETGAALLNALTQRADNGLPSTAGVVNDKPAGVFEPEATQTWSANAGAVAGATYAAYRALDGALSMSPVERGDT